MNTATGILSGGILLLVSLGLATAGGQEPASFTAASVRFEQNATDDDAEVVFGATGGDEGLATLKVVSPDGRTVIDFTAPDSRLGIRHFSLESPEPKNDGSVQEDYPEGEYTFTGTTVSGAELHGTSTLSHKLPDTAAFVRSGPDEEGVAIRNLEITWTAVDDLAAYVIVIEQDELDVSITARLPSSVTAFAIPDGFLLPDTEYKLAIGTVTEEGNTSFVETTFTTGEQE